MLSGSAEEIRAIPTNSGIQFPAEIIGSIHSIHAKVGWVLTIRTRSATAHLSQESRDRLLATFSGTQRRRHQHQVREHARERIGPQRHDIRPRSEMHSRSDYDPFEGFEITGWPHQTISRGEVIVTDRRADARAGRGQFLAREKFSPNRRESYKPPATSDPGTAQDITSKVGVLRMVTAAAGEARVAQQRCQRRFGPGGLPCQLPPKGFLGQTRGRCRRSMD
jgi:hypothetical protein